MKMNYQSVLIESRHSKNNTVVGTSGTLFNGHFAITTFHAISNILVSSDLIGNDFRRQPEVFDELRNVSFIIHVKNDSKDQITERNARFKRLLKSDNINECGKLVFRNWSFDYPIECLSLFVLLEIDGVESGRDDIEKVFDQLPKTMLFKGQVLRCISSAFGNKEFINHFSQGIVSNVAGKDGCLIFSDIPLTPGSEGSPVFVEQKQVVGIVLSTINCWKGEWLNFTIVADLRQLFSEILGKDSLVIYDNKMIGMDPGLLRTIECSIFQIYNGTIWGTAILINKKEGILITNSHVVESPHGQQIKLYQKSRMIPCDVVFSNSIDYSIDIAVLKTTVPLEDYTCQIFFCKKEAKSGDPVFAAGFPLFSKEITPGATITSGHLCHVHTSMIKTTCPVHPGASGGAILDENGDLIAVIVCNAKTSDPINMVYPRLNISIPAKLLQPILETYIESGDVGVLEQLSKIDTKIWNSSFKL